MDDYYTIRLPKLPITSLVWSKELPPGVQLVTLSTPRNVRRAVYRFAQFFRREFGYDFVLYGYDGQEDDPKAQAFLWLTDHRVADPDYRVAFGACCFRWREEEDRWGLQWIWFHPYMRRQGYLTEAWPYFRRRFGAFVPEPPLSDAMIAFLKKYGEDA